MYLYDVLKVKQINKLRPSFDSSETHNLISMQTGDRQINIYHKMTKEIIIKCKSIRSTEYSTGVYPHNA